MEPLAADYLAQVIYAEAFEAWGNLLSRVPLHLALVRVPQQQRQHRWGVFWEPDVYPVVVLPEREVRDLPA